jgi:hypothetical protein
MASSLSRWLRPTFSAPSLQRLPAWRPWQGRALVLAGILAAGVGMATPVEAGITSFTTFPVCAALGDPGPPCSFRIPPRRNAGLQVFLDWLHQPVYTVTDFRYIFSYDPTVLRFDGASTTLLCDLRGSGQPVNCPDAQPGSGTMIYGASGVVLEDQFPLDQAGLTITPEGNNPGMVTINYSSPTGAAINGERNFLALAFDLLVPIQEQAIVTYSPELLPDASLSTISCTYTKANGDVAACESASPSLSLRITADPVPAPLGLGGLSVFFGQSRRLRGRLRSRPG